MGTLHGHTCSSCGFSLEISEDQPFYVFAGEIQQKYCPKTKAIVNIFDSYSGDEHSISCQKEYWQEEFGDASICKNCKIDCLEDLSSIPRDEQNGFYICPRCGNLLDGESIICCD